MSGVIFCPDCGNLLEIVEEGNIKCELCKCILPAEKFSNIEVITKSSPSSFPSPLRLKRLAVNQPTADEQKETAMIKERCPKCGGEEMSFHTLQLRSADEGATVFYECPNCGYKFNTNN